MRDGPIWTEILSQNAVETTTNKQSINSRKYLIFTKNYHCNVIHYRLTINSQFVLLISAFQAERCIQAIDDLSVSDAIILWPLNEYIESIQAGY